MAEEEFRHMVRITRKDVDGNKTIASALTEIKGIGICRKNRRSTRKPSRIWNS